MVNDKEQVNELLGFARTRPKTKTITVKKRPPEEPSLRDKVIARRKEFAKQRMSENFIDGRNPEDKGDSKRHGVPTKASVSKLRKVAKQGGRKGQLAHWMANMKAGKAKNK